MSRQTERRKRLIDWDPRLRLTPNAKAHAHYTVERLWRVHNTAVSVNVKINAPIANGTAIRALCIWTSRLSYRYDSYRPVRAYRNNKL